MADLIVELETPLEEVETTVLLPRDIYEAEFIDVEKKIGPQKAGYLSMTPKIYKDGKGYQLLPENISLTPQSEWKLKTILIALGVSEPKGKKLNVTKMLFRKFNAEVVIGEFEGQDGKLRKKNEIVDYFPIAKETPTETKTSPSPTGKKETKKSKPEPEPEATEDDEVSFE